MSSSSIALARRYYLHVLNGGTLKPYNVSTMVSSMEAMEGKISVLEYENDILRKEIDRLKGE